ncbi:MAG: hypothetical protein SH850_01755 [Planctomycetaceae bacterium]|nr:hypothetical protein [Planctomycetaceae bacterium]
MSHLLGGNPYLIDPERRLAHRSEIRRELAKIAVVKDRVAELKNIIAKLAADSDRAAESHGVDAGRLQAEMDQLDQQQIECVLAGTPTPPEAIQRGRQILDQLTELNRNLETVCEGNRRAAEPVEKQINDLRMQTTNEGAFRNRLVTLASREAQQKLMLNGLHLQAAESIRRELQRLIDIHEKNVVISRKNRNGDDILIHQTKLADCEAVAALNAAEIASLHVESARLQDEARAE